VGTDRPREDAEKGSKMAIQVGQALDLLGQHCQVSKGCCNCCQKALSLRYARSLLLHEKNQRKHHAHTEAQGRAAAESLGARGAVPKLPHSSFVPP